MTQRVFQRSGRNLCFAARAVALLVGFGICCEGGDVFAQFTAVNSITSLPDGAVASTSSSTAVGGNATASATASTALGFDSTASGTNSTALGRSSTASGTNSTALGRNSTASATASTALGRNSTAEFDGSTAIGFGATTTRVDQMMFGTATNTYTAAGITSAASSAAQTGDRQFVTTDSSGNLASDTAAGLGLATTAGLGALQNDVGRNTEGVAMAMALSGVSNILPIDTNYSVSANWGTFGGENAMAFGGTARLYKNTFVNAGGAVGMSGTGANGGGRAGVIFAW